MIYELCIETLLFTLKACESAASANKWLIVNVQNIQEFACQVLNRDVWSNSTVKELIRRRFVLWQVDIIPQNQVITPFERVLFEFLLITFILYLSRR